MAADDTERAGFLTLPREIRDNIYLHLVVAEDPIQYDENFETLSHSDTFARSAMMSMFETQSNTQIARETREAFYQQNTFLIYTHDIPTLLEAESHAMSFEAEGSIEPKIYTTPFEAGVWVRKLAVRVGWHTSGGWFPDSCCLSPGEDLRVLLKWDSLRSVIIDARFGAWSFGYPQGIGWKLLKKMNNKWGETFKIYNDQVWSMDTRRYTSDRRDLSETFDLQDQSSQESEDEETRSEVGEQEMVYEEEEAELWEDVETGSEDEGEESEEQEEEIEEEEQQEEEGAVDGISSEEEAEEGTDEREEAWSGDEAEPQEWTEQDREDNRSW